MQIVLSRIWTEVVEEISPCVYIPSDYPKKIIAWYIYHLIILFIVWYKTVICLKVYLPCGLMSLILPIPDKLMRPFKILLWLPNILCVPCCSSKIEHGFIWRNNDLNEIRPSLCKKKMYSNIKSSLLIWQILVWYFAKTYFFVVFFFLNLYSYKVVLAELDLEFLVTQRSRTSSTLVLLTFYSEKNSYFVTRYG